MNSDQRDSKNWIPIRIHSWSITSWGLTPITVFTLLFTFSLFSSFRDTSFGHAIQARILGHCSLGNTKHAFQGFKICSQVPFNLIFPISFYIKLFTIRLEGSFVWLKYHFRISWVSVGTYQQEAS